MKRIFFGLILVFLDIKLHMTVAAGWIPDLIGYILILTGLRQLAFRSRWFARGRLPALLLAFCMAMQYAAAVVGRPGGGIPLWSSLALLLLELLLLYAVSSGMAELEAESGCEEMRADRLVFLWRPIAALFLLGWPAWRFAAVFRLCALAACVCYLAAFYTAQRAYENQAA